MKNQQMGLWIAVAAAIGTALGVALGNIALGVAMGVGIGAALFLSQNAQKQKKKDSEGN